MAGGDELLDYYQRELTYLRKMGVEFARTYPKVARRLAIGPDQSDDPNVERLIESVAFLTARVQRNLEAEFPRFTQSMLGLLYPQLIDPVPAMAIARFDVDPTQGKLTTGFTIARHTPLFTKASDDVLCRFRTCYPVTLWPLRVTAAGIESTDPFDFLDTHTTAAVLRIRVRLDGIEAGKLPLDRLRFYLNADPMLANALYELLFSQVDRVVFLAGGKPITRPADQVLQPVGFGADEGVLPYPAHAQPGYRLIQEYFALPEKFRFFDLAIPKLPDDADSFDILLLLDTMPRQSMVIDATTFALGCTPVINLFHKTAEPIRIRNRQTEYRLVGDYRRERSTEIHSVLSVTGLSAETGERTEYRPFFSFDHTAEESGANAFWAVTRQLTGRKDLPGTDLSMAFLNLDFRPELPHDETILVETLCTNRTLVEQVPPGALFSIEMAAPVARIVCLHKPTHPRTPPIGGDTVWRLISQLSVNYLSLSDGADSLRALKEILRLHAPAGDASAEQQIQGLRDMQCRRAVRRVGEDAWRGFCRGIGVALEVDERRYVGGSAFLLSAVLDRFFGLYTTVNSFTQLTVTSFQRSGVWKAWPPRIGSRQVL